MCVGEGGGEYISFSVNNGFMPFFQWASMFPVEQVTEQQSALFAKKLLAVAISNLTYLRAIFPERAYGDRCLGGT